ncbi:methionine gamma-lyase [Pseudomaricurvus alkylphenolicus]|jgi:methionine-gamma-lyase|uniref:methionine gamma-lyase n=1 Tax=Pseudomaricurvus alkylphenolicus TaxID=1306991 RepID=UPI0014243751|nr:methionine gamma-lyase [Pseudomaricurvus alkylphenolicus]NIB41376.1 methionine gamma-lyase [Pseudomaricurvus alkylphenolicus]
MKEMTSNSNQGFATRAIHQGYDPLDHQGALAPPVYMTSTFAFPDIANGGNRFAGEQEGYIYGRLGNPTQTLLEERMASLEGGEAALATASGMGAITSALWSLVKAGDEIIADKTLYGCTFAFLQHGMSKFGVNVRYVDMTQPEALAAAITDKTRVVYFETPSNPNNRLVDIQALVDIAHSRDLKVIVDNTYCTPYLQQPISLGADLVVHSATKYLGGHGDLVAGAVVGSQQDIDQIRLEGLKDMTGAVISPLDAFLIMRGLKTLELRMDRHCASAMAVAQQLQMHPLVERIHYPGLDSFDQHELACRQMRNFGGMIAFELVGGMEAGVHFMDALKLATRAVSLGDAETLVQHPASMTHSPYSAQERAEFGISDGLVRLSVGLETLDDIQEDIQRALDGLDRRSQVAVVA